jgi:hypothetical protein
MKMVSAGIAAVGLVLLAALSPTSLERHGAQVVVGEAAAFEKVLVHDIGRDRRWMLLLGATIVGYRLLRKHQAMFESSYLYPDAGELKRRAFDAANATELILEAVPINRVSEA